MVTAELAVVIPCAALVAMLLLWLIGLGYTQVRLVDGARETARLLARGEPRAEAVSVGTRTGPTGVVFTVEEADGLVVVVARARPAAPVLGEVGPVSLSARAVAAAESP